MPLPAICRVRILSPWLNSIAEFDRNLLDRAAGRRRHLHGGLVGFKRDQRLFGRDGRASLHMHLDDRHIFEFANVGHRDVDRVVDTAR